VHIEEAKPILEIQASDCFGREDTCREDVIKILSVVTITPRKGLEYLIEAFSRVMESKDNIELYLLGPVGDKKYKNSLEKLIDLKCIKSKVYWHKFISDRDKLFAFYSKADIFVLSSLSEGFPRVIWEAMSQGLPIISTNLETICERVANRNLIHFVPVMNVAATAKGIMRIINDGEYRKGLIERSHNYIRELLRESASEQFVRIANNLKILD
jgi:glycosyltransferase involved in cell wall biosynthesis